MDDRVETESKRGLRAADEIRTVLALYERALNTADPALALSCFTSDGSVMAQGLGTAAGTELRAAYDRFFQVKSYDIEFVVDEPVILTENFAYAITHSFGTITMLPDRRQHAGANREMFIFRSDEGRWRIARYLFNNDAAPPPPSA